MLDINGKHVICLSIDALFRMIVSLGNVQGEKIWEQCPK